MRTRTTIITLVLLTIIGLGGRTPLQAQEKPTADTELQKSWNQFADKIRELGPWLMSQPGVPKDDPQVRSDGYRYLATLLYVGLDIHLLNADPNRPQWTPTFTEYAGYGGDQHDGVYHSTQIDPSGTYRIVGRARGGLPVSATIQTMSGWWTPGMPNKTVKTQSVSGFELEADGSFVLFLGGPKRNGNWMALTPDITHLMARQYIADDSRQRPYALRIDRIDTPPSVPEESDTPRALAKKLRNATGFVKLLASSYLVTSRQAMESRNKLKPLSPEDRAALGASLDNNYYRGSWDLGADEALLIEITPTQAVYWSVSACNFWLQALPQASSPSEINNLDAVKDSDGKIRVVVSNRDPGYANWLATDGLKLGILVARWTLRKGEEHIVTRKVAFNELPSLMPKDSKRLTAAERQAQLQTLRTRVLTRYGR